MDASSRAIPDFVLTMSQATGYAQYGFSLDKNMPPYVLPRSLSSLFFSTINTSSIFLRRFHRLLPDVALIGAPRLCNDPIDYFLRHGSFKSARDRLKQQSSLKRQATLRAIARPELLFLLDELLISSSSYPIIGMCRSVPANRRPNTK